MVKKVYNLEAESVEVTYTEQPSVVEVEDGYVINFNPQYIKTVKSVPNKRNKKNGSIKA